ncbi:hypothetical protein [Sphingomicrobium astaxanthinifaciens]|uniref:hypothetical protein n=1 Tax=Sphingomicrobium astaxanthinifaciens TaxID=1227949 RepID=UPI001FCA8461|nr:hypothetical protein [Sphingomicrobium astaxanthinifaciens]MCJ7422378.1 hypothetical protein [Sphingomicrobium astaxanthinifaciens]
MAGQIKTIGGAVAVAAALMVGVPGAKMLGARLSVPAYEWRGTAEEFWPRFLTHRIAARDYAHIRIACPGAMPRHVYMLDHRLLQRSALEAARARHRACTVSQILR